MIALKKIIEQFAVAPLKSPVRVRLRGREVIARNLSMQIYGKKVQKVLFCVTFGCFWLLQICIIDETVKEAGTKKSKSEVRNTILNLSSVKTPSVHCPYTRMQSMTRSEKTAVPVPEVVPFENPERRSVPRSKIKPQVVPFLSVPLQF